MTTFRRYFNNKQTYIFITFVTYKRREILISNIDLFKESLKFAKTKFAFDIFAIVVMKEHCHLIISVENATKTPQIIKSIKYYFSSHVSDKYICKNISQSAKQRNEKGIWQRRYYDHIIRDEEDLLKHVDYIHFNSMKHYNIIPKDWIYSSFKKFVKNNFYDENWCNYNDKHKINELNYE